MNTNSPTNVRDPNVQDHCIDLPGETVQCWIGGGTEKLKIILRKHRDVIFDINLNNKNVYTLEATTSDFYDTRNKKLVAASQKGKISFKDGERLHLWISREFQGEFILRSSDKIIYKIAPNKLDTNKYSDDPKEKPAPIIITIGIHDNDLIQSNPANQNTNLPKLGVPALALAASTPLASDYELTCPVVCVIDRDIKSVPKEILDYFKKGGDHSGLSDWDENRVFTRNWLWGQGVGSLAYIGDNWKWLRASMDSKTSKGFQLVKAKVKLVGGKVRFYFSGYSNTNTIFGRGGYGPSHDRIITIFAGAGKTSSSFGALAKGIAGSFKGNALVSFIFGTATAVAEWKEDIQKDGYDLAAAIFMSIVKAIITAVLVAIVVATIVWLVMMAMGAAVPILLIGAITVTAGLALNYITEAADKAIGRAITNDSKNNDGIASVIAPWIRKNSPAVQAQIFRNWNYLMHKMGSDYQEIIF